MSLLRINTRKCEWEWLTTSPAWFMTYPNALAHDMNKEVEICLSNDMLLVVCMLRRHKHLWHPQHMQSQSNLQGIVTLLYCPILFEMATLQVNFLGDFKYSSIVLVNQLRKMLAEIDKLIASICFLSPISTKNILQF